MYNKHKSIIMKIKTPASIQRMQGKMICMRKMKLFTAHNHNF
jgi:hypothetical protein